MNVLLVNTNPMKPPIAPIGLDYLADSIVEEGHNPTLLDFCISDPDPRHAAEIVNRTAPDVVGFTIRNTDDCYFTSQSFFLPEISEMIQLVRNCTDVPTVLGGVGYSTAPEAILDFCGADFGIAGAGETSFSLLLTALEKREDLERVPNLLQRKNGTIVRNTSSQAELPPLPYRQRSLVNNDYYFKKGGQAGFETKRGCAMKCIYCADPVSKGSVVRLLPPAMIVEELATLEAQNIDHFHTCDSEFNLPPQHAQEVCRAIIERGLGSKIRWYAYCTPLPFDENTAILMKKAGCGGINFGVDSACDLVLRNLGRHFTVRDLNRAAQVCRRQKIPCMFDLLLGGPGETKTTIRETIDSVRNIGPDCVGMSLGLRVYPNTPLARSIHIRDDENEHPALYGAQRDNPGFLRPVFYISPELDSRTLIDYVHHLVKDDQRFFLPEKEAGNSNYNYNENLPLIDAIESGARGAYWDILRNLKS